MSSDPPNSPDRRNSDGDIESDSDSDEFFDAHQPTTTPTFGRYEFRRSQHSPQQKSPESDRNESFDIDHDKFGTPLEELRRGSDGSIIEIEIVHTKESMRQRLAQTMGFSRRSVMEEIAFEEPIDVQIQRERAARTRKVMQVSIAVLTASVATFVGIIALHNQGFRDIFAAINSTEGAVIALIISACLVPLTFILIALSIIIQRKRYVSDCKDQDSPTHLPTTNRSSRSMRSKGSCTSKVSDAGQSIKTLFKGKAAQTSSISLGSSKEGNLAIRADVC